ncbi:MAG: gamma-glutamylcyclotransferase [Gammaproteobacteria bacterium]|nr:gamma-glutamylcyclotransferase [Gammaproteobacteria bacterium]
MNRGKQIPDLLPLTPLRLFVYGTLKRGFHNHRFVVQASAIQPAWTWGRLWHLHAGFPALEVPDQCIIARASDRPRRDARVQAMTPPDEFPGGKPVGDWDLVSGEVVTLTDPDVDLPPIDRLEGFRSAAARNLYDRVLVTVWLQDGGLEPVTAWTYDGRQLPGRLGRCTEWPPAEPSLTKPPPINRRRILTAPLYDVY